MSFFNLAELYQNLYDTVDIIVNYYYNVFYRIELAICWQSDHIPSSGRHVGNHEP